MFSALYNTSIICGFSIWGLIIGWKSTCKSNGQQIISEVRENSKLERLVLVLMFLKQKTRSPNLFEPNLKKLETLSLIGFELNGLNLLKIKSNLYVTINVTQQKESKCKC